MVKGISQQAVVVRPPEDSPFEQAIFLLSEQHSGAALESPQALLALADQLVAQYSISPAGTRPGFRPDLRHGLAFVAGMALTGVIWLVTAIVGG